jgi:hypothetical protein
MLIDSCGEFDMADEEKKAQRAEQKEKVSGGLASLGVPTPERFLFTNFAAMPLWVRVVTYLLFVIVVVHGYLVPRAVSGTVDVLSKQGKTFTAYSNSLVSIVGDKSTRYFSNGREDGTWSIPVPTQIPLGFELEFAEKDNPQGREKLEVCPSDILLGHTIEVRYHPDGAGAKFTRVGTGCGPSSAQSGGAGDSASTNTFSWVSRAYAQAPAMKATAPRDVSRAIATAVQEAKTTGVNATAAQSASHAAANLKVELTSTEAASVQSSEQLSQLLQQKYYSKELAGATPVYLYVGQIDDAGNWVSAPNLKLDGSADVRPFRAGDVAVAQTQVNKRSDYIQSTLFGWRNADSLGIANAGDQFVVQDSKLIGRNLWIKAVSVKIDR